MRTLGHLSSQRLNRDVAELFSSNLDCTASTVNVIQTADSLNEAGSITLEVRVFDGPYRGGRFSFCFNIPASYPFQTVEVWAVHPIWHPNIDLRTGKVAIPLEWSPVLTLKSIALAVQMLMLEPTSENPLNLEAFATYSSRSQEFDSQTQLSIAGGILAGIAFPCVTMTKYEIGISSQTASKRSRGDVESSSSSSYCKRSRYGDEGMSWATGPPLARFTPSPRSLDNRISLLSLDTIESASSMTMDPC